MTDNTLRGHRILVVEDEFMLAYELSSELTDKGAIVLGPAGTIDDALALINTEPRIDGAVLDANLRGEMVFPAADMLINRNVPFVFTTGYDSAIIPDRYENVFRCGKPVDMRSLVQAIERVIHA